MSRCHFCKRKSPVIISCKWCVNDLCSSCLVVEIHKCKNISEMKEYNLKKLEQELIKHKTVTPKVIKI